MEKVKKSINRHCQKCKQVVKEKLVDLKIRGKKLRLCEDCSHQAKIDEEYRTLPPCQICRKPVHDKHAMLLKNGGIIHEKCYDGRDHIPSNQNNKKNEFREECSECGEVLEVPEGIENGICQDCMEK